VKPADNGGWDGCALHQSASEGSAETISTSRFANRGLPYRELSIFGRCRRRGVAFLQNLFVLLLLAVLWPDFFDSRK